MVGQRPCDREPDIVAACAGGGTTPEVEAHLAQCERCRDAVAVTRLMRRLADVPAGVAKLPDAGTLWWKAQIARRWEAERRSSAPVDAMERAELIVALIVVALATAWGLPSVWRVLRLPASPETVTRLAMAVDPSQLMAVIGAGLVVALGITVYLLHRTLFTDF
jgi:predicted anti-sigma-YlaC factor YlaD